MIPVLSHLFLKGRCRYCGEKVSWRYSLVELLTGSMFLTSYFLLGFNAELGFFLVFISIMIIITFIDIDYRIIPDRFFIIGLILSIGYLFSPLIFKGEFKGSLFSETIIIQNISDLPIKSALLGALVGGGFLLIIDVMGRLIYRKEGMGFGDVKLMIWAGIFLGFRGVIVALLFSVWIGAVAGVILLKMRKGKSEEDKYMPFGPFLTVGSIIGAFFAQQIINWYVSMM
jgi:leader peptidase (prepilin peptidase)/N-methyltransferase